MMTRIIAFLLLVVLRVSTLLSEDKKQELLNAHNYHRREVSPPASNMEMLTWSDELATMAQVHAQRCERISNLNASLLSVGENYEAVSISSTRNYTRIVTTNFFGERVTYLYASNTCSTLCNRYFQMVWAGTDRVGCGAALCETLKLQNGGELYDAYFLVCNYGQRFVAGERPYKSGNACTECPPYKRACLHGLCGKHSVDAQQCDLCPFFSLAPFKWPSWNGGLAPYFGAIVPLNTSGLRVVASTEAVAGRPYEMNCTFTASAAQGSTFDADLLLLRHGSVVGNDSARVALMTFRSDGSRTLVAKFNPLLTSDAGVYECRRNQNSVFDDAINYTVVVKAPAPNVTVVSQNMDGPVYLGKSLNLTCTIRLDQAIDIRVSVQVRWAGPDSSATEGDLIPMNGNAYQSSLYLPSINTRDYGLYHCVASVHREVNGSSLWRAYVDDSDAVRNGSVLIEAPFKSLMTTSSEAVAGRQYMINCTVVVLTTQIMPFHMELLWVSNGSIVSSTPQVTLTGLTVGSSHTLVAKFNPLQTTNAGVYKCQVQAGNLVLAETINHSVVVKIPAPIVTVALQLLSSVVIITPGQPLNMSCAIQLDQAIDIPVSVQIRWAGPDLLVTDNSLGPLDDHVYQSSLYLPSINTRDYGLYHCIASVHQALHNSAIWMTYIDDSKAIGNGSVLVQGNRAHPEGALALSLALACWFTSYTTDILSIH